MTDRKQRAKELLELFEHFRLVPRLNCALGFSGRAEHINNIMLKFFEKCSIDFTTPSLPSSPPSPSSPRSRRQPRDQKSRFAAGRRGDKLWKLYNINIITLPPLWPYSDVASIKLRLTIRALMQRSVHLPPWSMIMRCQHDIFCMKMSSSRTLLVWKCKTQDLVCDCACVTGRSVDVFLKYIRLIFRISTKPNLNLKTKTNPSPYTLYLTR